MSQTHDRRRYLRLDWSVEAEARILREGAPLSGRVRVIDISRGGLAFEHRAFQHVGTPCELDLPTLSGGRQTVRGRVAHCRFVGSGMHRIGVEFAAVVQLDAFIDRRTWPEELLAEENADLRAIGRLGFLDDSRLDHRLLRKALGPTGLELNCYTTGKELLEAFHADGFDVAVLDMHIGQNEDGVSAAKALRAAGFVGPMVLVSGDVSAGARASEGGFDAVLTKPYSVELLRACVFEQLGRYGVLHVPERVESRLPDTPEHREELREFVDVAGRMLADALAAIRAGSVDRLVRLCEQLHAVAGGYGFPDLERACAAALKALYASGSIAESRTSLLPVLHLLRRLPKGEGAASRADASRCGV